MQDAVSPHSDQQTRSLPAPSGIDHNDTAFCNKVVAGESGSFGHEEYLTKHESTAGSDGPKTVSAAILAQYNRDELFRKVWSGELARGSEGARRCLHHSDPGVQAAPHSDSAARYWMAIADEPCGCPTAGAARSPRRWGRNRQRRGIRRNPRRFQRSCSPGMTGKNSIERHGRNH